MASTYLSRTQSASTTRTKFTFSCWVKIASTSGYRYIASSYASNDNRLGFYMHTNYGFTCYARIQGADQALRINLAQHRDVNGWYHFVVKGDSTQSSQADRIKLYTNGVEVTDYQTDSSNNIGSSVNFAFGTTGHTFYIGNYDGTQYMYDGSMSHMHFCDGYAYDPSAFGETDSTTGEWKIKTSPNVTYGTNGFFLFKNDNAVTDRSGQGNNFTLGGGTLTKTEDCPSNVFATLDPSVPTGGGFQSNSSTFANGNTKFTTNNSSSNYGLALSTLGMTTGKYYAECKKISGGQGLIGIRGWQGTSTNNYLGDTQKDYAIYTNGNVYRNNSVYSNTGTSYADNDIIGVFVDCDNWKIYFSKNGTMINTTGITIGDITTDTNTRSLGAYFFSCCEWNSSGNGSWEWNFGNGAFGSTQLTGTTYNGSDGNGIFKYDPNNITLDSTSKSFKSLSTKGLNT